MVSKKNKLLWKSKTAEAKQTYRRNTRLYQKPLAQVKEFSNRTTEDKYVEPETPQIQEWNQGLLERRALLTFKKVAHGLHEALRSVTNEEGNTLVSVNRLPTFSEIVKICLTKIPEVLLKDFCVKKQKINNEDKFKKWRLTIRSYLMDMILLSKSVTNPKSIEAIVWMGIVPLLPFYVAVDKNIAAKLLLKQLITFWSTSHEKLRVSAFVGIFRMFQICNSVLYSSIMKSLYRAYLQNCRFTSPETWPMINFMRVSLAELYALHESVLYEQAFLNLRQITFHFRNAALSCTQDKYRLIFNWQIIHALHLWEETISKCYPSKTITPLAYPLVQVSLGCINLASSSVYFPFKFHIFNILTNLGCRTRIFIPVLAPILEILTYKPSHVRGFHAPKNKLAWECILKLSRGELCEKGFADNLIEMVYESALTCLSVDAGSIGFPEYAFLATVQIKQFLTKLKRKGKMNELLDIIEKNSAFILERRKNVTFGVTDTEEIKAWEIATRKDNPPMYTAYSAMIGTNFSIIKKQADLDDPSMAKNFREERIQAKYPMFEEEMKVLEKHNDELMSEDDNSAVDVDVDSAVGENEEEEEEDYDEENTEDEEWEECEEDMEEEECEEPIIEGQEKDFYSNHHG